VKRLILTADDFGIVPEVNEAVELHVVLVGAAVRAATERNGIKSITYGALC
jgi:hypothetical protein